MTINEFRTNFDRLLMADIQTRQESLKNILSDSTLTEYINKAIPLMSSGKRIRPYIAALIYSDSKNNSWEQITPQLIALEYFHTFALVHDDIMDRSDTRRGTETIHSAVSSKIKTKDSVHIGYSQAIIIGDLLYSFSQQSFRQNLTNLKMDDAYKAFDEMANEVMIGQMLDVDLTIRNLEETDPNLVDKKTFLKTAGYTFVNPIKIGANLAQRNLDKFAEDFGTAIGVAFQIKDDILDIIGTIEETGKTPLCDVKEGQKTILTNFIIKNSDPKYKDQLKKYLGQPFTKNDFEDIRNIFIKSGAIKNAEEQAKLKLDEAKSYVENSDLQTDTKDTLYTLIEKLRIRKS